MGSVSIPDFGRWNTLGRRQGYSSQRVESTALSKKPLEASSHSVKKQDRRNYLHVVVSVYYGFRRNRGSQVSYRGRFANGVESHAKPTAVLT